ncbi:MAG: hypothetical protein A2Y72_07735 [Chloroflexi bacterium RBG_13_53_26]|nr:MAG: hypothetical protein A2Y72_07735 [Chloroflexi bacterium RBG_13_53_26]
MTTSTLNTTVDGRNALLVAARYLLQRRLSRFFKRNLVIDYNEWLNTGQFPLATLLGQLNGLHDPEILNLYHLLGTLGGLSTSIADTTIYVDGTNGNDTTGDGSYAEPFKTLWFMELIPRQLEHKYRVVLKTDVNDPTRNLVFNFTFGPGGSFALLGSGVPTVLQAGNVVGAIGQLRGQGGSYAACVSGFTPDVETSFLRSKGYAVPCHKLVTGANVLFNTFPFQFAGVAPADTIDVVRPARTLTVNTIGSFCQGITEGKQSQLAICNLNIAFDLPIPGPFGPRYVPKFKWNNDCVSTLSFVRLLDSWTGNQSFGVPNGNTIKGGQLNTDCMLDQNMIISLANCGVINLDYPDTYTSPFLPYICGAKFDGASGGVDITDASINAVDMNVFVNQYSWAKISQSSFGKLACRNASLYIEYCIADGQVASGGLHLFAGIEGYNANIDAEHVTTLVSDNCFSLFGGSYVKIVQCGSDATYSVIGNAGIWVEGTNTIDAFYNDPGDTPVLSGLIGALANLIGYTASSGEGIVAWPAIDTQTYIADTTSVTVKR